MKRLLLLLACLLALCTTVVAAEPAISDMKTDCTLTGSGACQVTQTFTMEISITSQNVIDISGYFVNMFSIIQLADSIKVVLNIVNKNVLFLINFLNIIIIMFSVSLFL